MIRKANDQDKTALREIWSAAFNDPLSYADFVIEHCLKLGTVLFDDRGRSFLTRFPLTLMQKGKILLQGFYIYGLATHPVQQGKGFGSLLLTKAVEETPFCLLYPATPELQRFYYNRGFITPVRIPDAVSKTGLNYFTNNTLKTPKIRILYFFGRLRCLSLPLRNVSLEKDL